MATVSNKNDRKVLIATMSRTVALAKLVMIASLLGMVVLMTM